MSEVKVTERHIKDYSQDPTNARRHTPRNLGMIEDSLNENGAGRSILVDDGDVIIAGNGTIEAAAAAGVERVIEIETDGDALIVHKRRNLTGAQRKKLAIVDNAASDASEWDRDRILALVEDGDDAVKGVFNDKEIKAMIADREKELKAESATPKADVEFAEELREEHNYVVLYSDNDVDWLQFETLIGDLLGPVKARHSQEGFESRGVGRVIRLADAIARLRGER